MPDQAATAPKPFGFVVRLDAGHPWDRKPGWAQLEVNAPSQSALKAFIERAAQKFWAVWIEDNTGKCSAVLYKPVNATGPWNDFAHA